MKRWYTSACLLIALVACGGDPASPESTNPPVSPPATPGATTVTPLRKIAEDRGLRFGVGTAVGSLFNSTDAASAQYMTVLAREFNVLTPENEMKFNALQPARGTFRYNRADSMVAFAKANNMKVRGHALAWHSQLPSWISSGTFSAAEATVLLNDHITNVVTHYKGQLAAWDVVNEAFNDGTASLRPGFWSDRLGRGYIEQAFRSAFAADPATPLYYNDYNIEGLNAKSDSVYELLRDLRARGVPVHGVGMQMHLIVGALPSASDMAANFARFAALELKIQITELDIRTTTPATTSALETQAQNYRTIFNLCAQSAACDMVVMWGFTDRASWIPSTFPGQGAALLYDANFVAKPAYTAVNDFLAGR